MTKIIFKFDIQSVSDVITNSSSELFVFDDQNSEEEIISILDSIYPNWSMEYETPIQANKLDDEAFEDYLSWMFGSWDDCELKRKGRLTKENSHQADAAKYYNFNPSDIYENWDEFDPTHEWNNKLSWNDNSTKSYLQYSREGLNLIRSKIPDTTWLLYSISDNPDWEYQEILSDYAKRYHLG